MCATPIFLLGELVALAAAWLAVNPQLSTPTNHLSSKPLGPHLMTKGKSIKVTSAAEPQQAQLIQRRRAPLLHSGDPSSEFRSGSRRVSELELCSARGLSPNSGRSRRVCPSLTSTRGQRLLLPWLLSGFLLQPAPSLLGEAHPLSCMVPRRKQKYCLLAQWLPWSPVQNQFNKGQAR